MRAIDLSIIYGDEDSRLLEHIDYLSRNFIRLTPGEEQTLLLAWKRLDLITRPKSTPEWVDARRYVKGPNHD